MNDNDETKVRKINISNKAKVKRKSEITQGDSSKRSAQISNRAIAYIFVFVALFGYSAFYVWDKNFREKLVAVKPVEIKPKVKSKPEPKVASEKEVLDLKSVILSPKCISKLDKSICKKLNSYRVYDGLEGAYSIATNLYIVVELKEAFNKLKSTEFDNKEKEKVLTFVRSNMAREVNSYKLEKNNYVYRDIKFDQKLGLATLIADLKSVDLNSELLENFDQIFLVGYLYLKSSVSQEVVVKENVKSYLEKMNKIELYEAKMIFRGGFVKNFPYFAQGFTQL